MITVIGCDGSTLGERARDALAQATLVVGAPRHVAAAGLAPGTPTMALGNVDEAMCRLAGHAGGSGDATRHGPAAAAPTTPAGPAAVLASGDPGFFGIVRRLRAAGLAPQVLPAVSSVALAFARIGLPWDDAVVVSAHGRDPRPALAAARARRKVAVLTSPECGPAQVGAAVAGWDRALVVCERLGAPDERVRARRRRAGRRPAMAGPQRRAGAGRRPAARPAPTRPPTPPLARTTAPHTDPGWIAGGEATPAGWALPDDAFEHRAGMLTKYEVRAVALSRLAPRLGTLVWDVGAGSGSVAVECARFGAAVLAVERDADEIARIRRNARAHAVTVRAVHGEAPAALAGLPDPDAVFVGGGGPAVVDACAARRPAAHRRRARRRRADRTDHRRPHQRRLCRRRRACARVQARLAAGRRAPPRRNQPGRAGLGGARMIGLVAVTAAGRAAADRLAAAWPDARRFDGPAAAAVPRAWQECDGLVCFLAAGATVRLIAPLLDSKDADPAVVAVDEAGRWAVPLLGGHGQRRGQGHELRHGGGHAARPGANELAQRVADVLGAEPVVTTATDARNVPGLDTLGWPVEGAVATVSRAILDGEPVRLDADATWPLPALPPNVGPALPPNVPPALRRTWQRPATGSRWRACSSPTGTSTSTAGPRCCDRRRWSSGSGRAGAHPPTRSTSLSTRR